MARRHGSFDDLMEIGSKLPWQVGVALAVASGLVFHFVAAAFSLPPKLASTAELGSVVVQQGIHTFSYFLQFVCRLASVSAQWSRRSNDHVQAGCLKLLRPIRRSPSPR